LLSKQKSATREMGWRRTRATNLEATRGDPKVWLVAHIDSKSQTVPILVRSVSSTAILVMFFGATIGSWIAQWTGHTASIPWLWIAGVATIAALPSLFCFIRNESAGALDNATGVAAVLLAARTIPQEKPLGVLITTAEELDLAGAREWAVGRRGITLINCDTVDDSGGWRCMYQSRPHAAILASQKAATRLGITLRVGKIIPGILTDSIAFDLAGLSSVTISRGTLGTLARLHTPRDTSDRVTGAGAATAARLLAATVEDMN
jgi:Predicted aminopeptidase, Iap family